MSAESEEIERYREGGQGDVKVGGTMGKCALVARGALEIER